MRISQRVASPSAVHQSSGDCSAQPGPGEARRIGVLPLAEPRAAFQVEHADPDAAGAEIKPQKPRHLAALPCRDPCLGPEHHLGEEIALPPERLEHAGQRVEVKGVCDHELLRRAVPGRQWSVALEKPAPKSIGPWPLSPSEIGRPAEMISDRPRAIAIIASDMTNDGSRRQATNPR
ncbi:MAG: hypothetical protein M0Z28_24285 [Rhodospirillales bacterium]|nr:hypothetical protein [Rhodospirillales bacterium]